MTLIEYALDVESQKGLPLGIFLFDEVRGRCHQVTQAARHVQIDIRRIDAYAKMLPVAQLISRQLDPSYHYVGEPSQTVAYILILDAVNFGSGYFPQVHERSDISGYFTIAASLKRYFESHGPLTPAEIASISAVDCALIFGQEQHNEVSNEFMNLVASALNQLGRYVLERFHGEFTGVVKESHCSAATLVRLLLEMPSYQDVAYYHGIRVPFYKRAQITVADLSLAFNRQGWGNFSDLEQLTIFADNALPHVLRVDGILRYDTSLARKIALCELIRSGSDEEIEIRASAVHAAELIVHALKQDGREVTAMTLDHLLWNRSQEPSYRSIPRHLTRTWFY